MANEMHMPPTQPRGLHVRMRALLRMLRRSKHDGCGVDEASFVRELYLLNRTFMKKFYRRELWYSNGCYRVLLLISNNLSLSLSTFEHLISHTCYEELFL